jgi:hypothetical protein
LSNSPTSELTGLTSVDPTQFDTTSLNDLVTTKIPSLVSDLTALTSTITTAYNSDTAADLTFSPGGSGASEQASGLANYKAQLLAINTTLGNMIDSLNNQILGNAIQLISQIDVIKTDADDTIVIFKHLNQ